MIEYTELGLIALLAALNVFVMIRGNRRLDALFLILRSSPAAPAKPTGETVAILQRGQRSGKWEHHSFRPEGHKDIQEALETPGFAIMRNGKIEEGKQ